MRCASCSGLGWGGGSCAKVGLGLGLRRVLIAYNEAATSNGVLVYRGVEGSVVHRRQANLAGRRGALSRSGTYVGMGVGL
eukprot:1156416-Pelagomonas_calceolata.AAC.4